MSNSSKINLLQMQHYFEEQVDRIHIISDLELSENDYRSLGAKLNAFSFFAGSENDIEEYILSIIVYSTYTLIYGQDIEDFDTVIRMLLKKSQYAERMRLIMYRDAFYSYGINTFEVSGDDIKQWCKELTALHAGIPNSEKDEFFDIMAEFLDITDVNTFYKEALDRLPKRTRFIFDMMEEYTIKKLLLDIRNMMNDVVDGLIGRDELISKHGNMSISLIDRCIMWNENNEHIIRFGNNYKW